MRILRLGLLAAALSALPAGAADVGGSSDLVGPESCKACHPEAYNAWKLSKHARALESLSQQQQKDGRCVSCHSPAPDTNVAGVSCETCHGPGKHYSTNYVMKDAELARLVGLVDPSEKSCRSCHDASAPSLRPFDFVEKLKLIDHWSAARKKASEARALTPEPTKAKK
jgi:hypothetical protein